MSHLSRKEQQRSPSDRKQNSAKVGVASYGCLAAILAPFFIAGVSMLVTALNRLDDLGSDDNWVLLVMGVVFTGIAVLPFYALVTRGNSLVTSLPLRKAYPGQPWMWREDWARGVVEDKTKGAMIGKWIVALVTGAIATFAGFKLGDMLTYYMEANPALAWALLGVGLGMPVWLIVRAIYATLQFRKFGSSRLVLSKVPCTTGSYLAGRIDTSLREAPQDGVSVSLECVKEARSDHDRKRTVKTIVWSDTQNLESFRLGQGPEGVYIPVQMAIPASAEPTGKTSGGPRYFWRLTAKASVPGVDYRAEFEPPVFRLNQVGLVDENSPLPS